MRPRMLAALVTVTAGAVAGLRCRADLLAAQARLEAPPVAVRRLTTDRATIEFTDSGSGPVVLVLHGNGGRWDQGLDWASRRLGKDHRVVAVSRFGYLGSSVPPAAGTANQADVLAELLDLLGVDRVDVVTLSAGSAAGLQFAVRHPERLRSLVLEAPAVPSPTPKVPPRPILRALLRVEVLFWLLTRYRRWWRPWWAPPGTASPTRTSASSRRSRPRRCRCAPAWTASSSTATSPSRRTAPAASTGARCAPRPS